MTASIVDLQERERDQAAAAMALQSEWQRGRWKIAVIGLSAIVWLLGFTRAIYSGGSLATLATVLVVALLGSTAATAASLLLTARIGFLSARSRLSLLTLSIAAPAAGSATGLALVMVGLPILSLPAAMVVHVAVLSREIHLEGFTLVAIIGSHLVLVSAIGMFA